LPDALTTFHIEQMQFWGRNNMRQNGRLFKTEILVLWLRSEMISSARSNLIMVSGFSPAAGKKNGQFNQKKTT
jgi:hypothetical protein